jgi:hypothetical protein
VVPDSVVAAVFADVNISSWDVARVHAGFAGGVAREGADQKTGALAII